MQKLNLIRHIPLSERGSTLLGALALVAALSIAGLSFLRVAVTSAHNEQGTLDDSRAFLAAESGALLGARWLRGRLPFPEENNPFKPFTNLQINGYSVEVNLIGELDTVSSELVIRIDSEAFSDAVNHTAGTFQKRIIYRPRRSTFGEYNTFFNSASAGWGGFWNRTFNGRFHMNTRMIINSRGNPVRFTDKVTVANTSSQHWDYGDGTHHNNNYDYGVNLNSGGGWSSPPITDLDVIFAQQYLANQDQIQMPTQLSDLSTGLPAHAHAIALPGSDDQGSAYDDYRPTLSFKADGSAVYNYKNGSAYDSVVYADINEKIFYSEQNLNVLGTVRGNTSVVSAANTDIVIAGDLVYHDYDYTHTTSSDNDGVPMASPNVLGLVPGQNVTFVDQWRKDFNGSASQVTLGGGLEANKLHVNASIIAAASDGTEYWNRSRSYSYDLIFSGNHILDLWRPPSSGRSSGGAKAIVFNHDLRLINRIQPHGFPYAQTSGGLWQLTLQGWSEENVH